MSTTQVRYAAFLNEDTGTIVSLHLCDHGTHETNQCVWRDHDNRIVLIEPARAFLTPNLGFHHEINLCRPRLEGTTTHVVATEKIES